MPSNSQLRWRGERAASLDEIEAAHVQVGGTARGRRYATQQIIGAKVSFSIAGRLLVGRVLEDRGPIGRGGRHLYLVRYEAGRGNWYSTELPAEEIEKVEHRPVNLRKKREVEYIIPVEAGEAHSLFARPEHAQPLADFLRSQGVRFTEDSDAVQGEINFLIEKSTPWGEFVALLNEWKRQYAEGSAEPGAAPDRARK